MVTFYSPEKLDDIFQDEGFINILNQKLKSKKSNDLRKFLNSLPTNKNYYKSGQRNKFSRGFKKQPTQSEETQTIKKVNVLLNKISPLNLQKIIDGVLLELKFYPHLANIVTESILEKAIIQSTYCNLYVDLIIQLIKQHNIKHILGKLLIQFKDKYITNEYILDKDRKKIDENLKVEEAEKTAQEKYDEFCDKNKMKDYLMGYTILIVELYNKKLLNLNYINMIVNILLNKLYYTSMEDMIKPDILDLVENNVFCVHKLFMTMKDKENLSGFVKKIDILLDKKKYKPKLRFKLMDIKDMY